MPDDLTTARLMERQILQERFQLACGCAFNSKYGHPVQRGWRLINEYAVACTPHEKLYKVFDKEKRHSWADCPFIPRWRDENGLWILREEWDENTYSEEHGVFQYKGFRYLLLIGSLGYPVVLVRDDPKMNGRIISLDLLTGKTFPAPVPPRLLHQFE